MSENPHDPTGSTTTTAAVPRPAPDRPAQRPGPARPARPVRRGGRRRGGRLRGRRLLQRLRPAHPRPDRRSTAGRPPGGGGDANVSVAEGEIPEETGGPFPGDGSNGLERAQPRAASYAATSPASFGSASGDGRGRAADDPDEGLRPQRRRRHRADGRGGLRLALRPRRRATRCTTPRSPRTRTTCAASRRPTPRAGSSSPASSRRRTPVAGRTSTSRSTRAWTTRPAASSKLRTSQLALPEDVCEQVYEADGYEQSVSNLSQTSLDSDNVFSDGYSLQMAKVTGSNDEGYVATLNVPV